MTPLVRNNPTLRQFYGIRVGLYPSSNPNFEIELQRSSTSSTWATVARIGNDGRQQSRGTFTDQLPNDNLVYSYRARHVRSGYTASAWTPTVNARPTLLPPQSAQPVAAASAIGIPTGAVPKRLRVPFGRFDPASTSNPWAREIAYIRPNVNDTVTGAIASVVLPPNVTMTNINAFVYAASTNQRAELIFWRSVSGAPTSSGSTAASVRLATLVSTTISTFGGSSGWQTYSSTLNETVSSETTASQSVVYSLNFLARTTGGAGNVRLSYVDILYRMPNYVNAY